MCEHGTEARIILTQVVTVDACIAGQVRWLNEAGVRTEGCCCGHGKSAPQAVILPSAARRAEELGYVVTHRDGLYPTIVLKSDWSEANGRPVR